MWFMCTRGYYVFGFCGNWRERATFAAVFSGSIPANLAEPDLGLAGGCGKVSVLLE